MDGPAVVANVINKPAKIIVSHSNKLSVVTALRFVGPVDDLFEYLLMLVGGERQ